ncbi:MAG: glycosyl hydrolase [Armatimonadota bacterium]|nr:glycosyl hydrolase [Armatimonadota bacterium]
MSVGNLLGFACLCLFGLLPQVVQADPIDGVYRLTTRGQPNMAVDIENWGNANGTPVSLYWSNKTSNQQWRIERQSDGSYRIYAFSGQNSVEMLDCANGNVSNGNSVATWEDNGNSAQNWYFVDVGGGFYRIIPQNAGINSLQTLDCANGNNAGIGSRLAIYGYWGGDNQVFKLDWAGTANLLINGKKGMSGGDKVVKIPAVNATWCYTWGSDKPGNTPSNVEFVPMQWGYYGGDNTGWLRWVAGQAGVKSLLAFNEPDHTDQANLSVNDALTGYRYMANIGTPIGSPACADDMSSWMQTFMDSAGAQGLRVDYVAVHCYIRDPWQFLSYIDQVHTRYNKQLWITEFAPADWSGNNPVSDAEAANFMKIVVPRLNSLWYVDRYAWYSGAAHGNWTLGSAALVEGDGSLTPLGRLYARM